MTTRLISTPHVQHGAALPWMLLLILLAALAALAWFGREFAVERLTRLDDLARQVVVLEQLQQQQREQYDDQVALLAERLNGIDRMLEERDRRLAEMQESGMRRWLVAEAEALASLAGQRLLLTADLAATRRLLAGADATLARIADPRVLPARRALAADMEAVRAAEQVDVAALVLRLAALQELVAGLAVPALPVAPEPVGPALAADQDQAGHWWQSLLASLPVRIQQDRQLQFLPLDAQQAALLRLALDNSLQQAQLALLQARPAVYQAALVQADGLIQGRFRADDARARHLRSALAELQQASVEQALPEIGAGLAAIRLLKMEPLE